MNPINNISAAQGAARTVNRPVMREVTAERPASNDRVELSGMSGLMQTLRRNDIRAEKVAAVKAQIEAGGYEDDRKLEIAADRLLDDLSR